MESHRAAPQKPLTCPGRCGRTRRVGKLLCRECWHRLPASPRSELYKSWRAAESNLGSDVLWARYMQSRRVALAALR